MSFQEDYKAVADQLSTRLATSGLRSTVQRQHVYDVMRQTLDHPTAEEVFMRAKQAMPDISIATVYNCLDALVKCNLVRQVKIDRGATRYCPNMKEHCHFFCEECGKVYDIERSAGDRSGDFVLPPGFKLTHAEISLKGICSHCSSQAA